MNNQENRSLEAGFEIRKDDDKVIVEGYAARFEDETVIGGQFAEKVARGAFEGADMKNTVALFNHDWNQPLARVGHGLELEVDEVGLRYRFELGDQSYARDLAENIRMGNVSTSSFGFTVADDSWERREGMNLRTITSVGTLFDVSPTTQGAYPTTEVGLRSMEAALDAEVEAELRKLEEENEEEKPEEKGYDSEEAPKEEEEKMHMDKEEDEEEKPEERPGHYEDEDEEEEEKSEHVEEDEDEDEEEEARDEDEDEDKEEKTEDAPADEEEEEEETNNKSEETRNNSISEMENTTNGPAIVQNLGDNEARSASSFDFGKFVKEAAKGNVTGLEGEMIAEGTNEMRNAGLNVAGGFNIPSAVLRSMGTATVSSGATEFGGGIAKSDEGIIENYAPADLAAKLGVRNLGGLSGDVAMQVQANLTAAGAAVGEGVARAEALPTFAEVVLQPTRNAAHVGVTQQMLAQSGDDMQAFIQKDIRRALDKVFNAQIIAAMSAAETASTYNATSNNPLDIEAALLAADVDLADVRILAAADAYRAMRALSFDAGSGDLFAGSPVARKSIAGYATEISSQVDAGELMFFDKNQMVTAQWGGLNLIVDPYTDAAKGVVRIIANEYRDVKVMQDASFLTLNTVA